MARREVGQLDDHPFALCLPLLAIGVTFITESLGAILWMVSTAVIAWRGWQESAVVA
ncbi:MAG: hypothetical protein ACT4OP_10600 [Actinomycetota bacterium]